MPRIARQKSQTGEYHVMIRGINHQNIFNNATDFRNFLKIIYCLKQMPVLGNRDSDWFIVAYALMDNHVHLLIKEGDVPIGDIVKKIAGTYVRYFNKKYGRDGHLFKERFKSEPCETNDYFVTLLRYIHQNPLKANIVKNLSDYEFTSWHEYIVDGKNSYNICNTQYALDRINLDRLTEIVNNQLPDNMPCLDIEDQKPPSASDDEANRLFMEKMNIYNKSNFKNLDMASRRTVVSELRKRGCDIAQLSRLTKLKPFLDSNVPKSCQSCRN